jgi:hypothetical protein
MSFARRFAERVLRAILRRAPDDSRDWANAVLRELDFIESDWTALLWAIGGAFAMIRYSLPRWLKRRLGDSRHGKTLTIVNIHKKAAGVATEGGMAAVVALCATGLVQLVLHRFPGWDSPISWWLGIVIVPEIIFMIGAIALWRKQKPVAVGLLLLGITLVTHFAIHAASVRNR